MRFSPFFHVMSYCYHSCHIFFYLLLWLFQCLWLLQHLDIEVCKACAWQGCSEIMSPVRLQVSPACASIAFTGKMPLICLSINESHMWLCYIGLFYYQKATKTRFSLKMFLTVVQHQVNPRKNRVRDSENYGDLLACSWRFFNGFIGAPRCPNCSSISERNELVLASSRAFA